MKHFAENFSFAEPKEVLTKPLPDIRQFIKEGNFDIIAILSKGKKDYEKIANYLKNYFPNIPLLVYVAGIDDNECTKRAEDLRSQGYFAFNCDEACYKQEFMDRLIATALGQEGLERLRISPIVFENFTPP